MKYNASQLRPIAEIWKSQRESRNEAKVRTVGRPTQSNKGGLSPISHVLTVMFHDQANDTRL
jgi:hypothetical protein